MLLLRLHGYNPPWPECRGIRPHIARPESRPREIVFLVDVSGSISGQATDKVRDVMQRMLQFRREQDKVQVLTFASQAQKLRCIRACEQASHRT